MWREAEDGLRIVQLSEDEVRTHRTTLHELMQICMRESFGAPAPDHWVGEKLDGLREYLRAGKAVLLGALEGEELQGFLWGYETQELCGANFHIAYVAVLPAFRKRGAGAALMRAAEDRAREMGLPGMELIVSAGNQTARRFYAAQAYEQTRVIMKKKLTEERAGC